MTRGISYGDPGGYDPGRQIIYPNRAAERWRRNVSLPLGGSPTNMQFDYDPGWASGTLNVPEEGLLGSWLQDRSRFMGGLQYGGMQPYGFSPEAENFGGAPGISQPNVGQFGLGGVPASASTPVAFDYGQYGLDRTPTNASTPAGEGYNPFRPGVAYDPAGNYPAAAYAARQGTGVSYQPPGQATAGGGYPGQDITYDNIRKLEQELKAAGKTGQTVFRYDDNGNIQDIIRRDGQGNILSIRKNVSGATLKHMRRHGGESMWSNTGTEASKTLAAKAKYRQYRVKRQRERRSSGDDGSSSSSGYPNWVINMSNWRGI